MRNILLNMITLLLINNIAYSQNSTAPKFETLAHELLYREHMALHADSIEKAEKKIQENFALLDKVISKSMKVLPKYDHEFTAKEVEKVFTKIDSVLYSEGFFICLTIGKITTGFTPIIVQNTNEKDDSVKMGCESHCNSKGYRKKFMETLFTSYRIDCDLGSIIFYSIGQKMNYPIFMIEVPRHNFVRWRTNETTHYNWDVNAGKTYTDNQYRAGESETSFSPFNSSDELIAHFLVDMDSKKIMGYYLPFIAVEYKRRGLCKKAEELYDQALEYKENDITSLYYPAYMYLYNPDYKDVKYQKKAFELSKKAYELINVYDPSWDTKSEIIETYACGCASQNDFELAIKLVEKSTVKKELIDGFREKKKCYEIITNR